MKQLRDKIYLLYTERDCLTRYLGHIFGWLERPRSGEEPLLVFKFIRGSQILYKNVYFLSRLVQKHGWLPLFIGVILANFSRCEKIRKEEPVINCRNHSCSGPWKPGSWCCLSKAHSSFGETRGGREIGVGREWGGGGQFTSNLGPRWTGPHHAKGGIPSKWKGIGRGTDRETSKGSKKGNCAITLYYQYMYVYI